MDRQGRAAAAGRQRELLPCLACSPPLRPGRTERAVSARTRELRARNAVSSEHEESAWSRSDRAIVVGSVTSQLRLHTVTSPEANSANLHNLAASLCARLPERRRRAKRAPEMNLGLRRQPLPASAQPQASAARPPPKSRRTRAQGSSRCRPCSSGSARRACTARPWARRRPRREGGGDGRAARRARRSAWRSRGGARAAASSPPSQSK